jgi:hypothetical protein
MALAKVVFGLRIGAASARDCEQFMAFAKRGKTSGWRVV